MTLELTTDLLRKSEFPSVLSKNGTLLFTTCVAESRSNDRVSFHATCFFFFLRNKHFSMVYPIRTSCLEASDLSESI